MLNLHFRNASVDKYLPTYPLIILFIKDSIEQMCGPDSNLSVKMDILRQCGKFYYKDMTCET